MTDQDQRQGKEVLVLIKDKIPQKAETRLLKILKGDIDKLTNAKDGFHSYGDETTSNNDLIFEYITSLAERKKIISEVGMYEIEAKVSDKAGNFIQEKIPVLVYEDKDEPKDGYIIGRDFEVDYNKWVSASNEEKRQILIAQEYGKLQGFELTNQSIADVTNNPNKLVVDFSGHNWQPKKTYDIKTKLNSYNKIIRVTLVPAEVEMNPNQVYGGTEEAIYKGLSTNTNVDNSKKIKVKVGDNLEKIVNQLLTSRELELNYKGYSEVKIKDFKVFVNGKLSDTKVVPNQNFQLIYEYVGQMKFSSAPNLNFGDIEVSHQEESYKLAGNSESDVTIINTLRNDNWHLKVSLPKGISNTQSKEKFLGQLIYVDSEGKEYIITEEGKKIREQQLGDKSLSKVDVRGTGKNGMTLKQEIGNMQGKYEGELVWSLEDGPKQ